MDFIQTVCIIEFSIILNNLEVEFRSSKDQFNKSSVKFNYSLNYIFKLICYLHVQMSVKKKFLRFLLRCMQKGTFPTVV